MLNSLITKLKMEGLLIHLRVKVTQLILMQETLNLLFKRNYLLSVKFLKKQRSWS